MTQNQAFIPQLITQHGNRVWQNVLSVALGVGLISALAQISITLPFTPVPITGQTFGVALTALLWGRWRALSTVSSYLIVGGLGFPVFAMGKSGLTFGPTLGYLIGMLAASYAVGSLADKAWTKTFFKTWLAAIMGSLIVFAFGLYGLSFFIPKEQLITAGLLPFIPGDIIKNVLASTIAWRTNKLLNKNNKGLTN